MSAEIYNIGDRMEEVLGGNNYVRVEAGYGSVGRGNSFVPTTRSSAGQASDPSPRTIFYGNLFYALPYRDGSEKVWRMAAKSTPSKLENFVVPLSFSSPVTIGAIMQKMLARLGGTIRLPHIATGASAELPDYSTTGPVRDELRKLVKMLSDQTDREYKLMPRVSAPFDYDLVQVGGEAVEGVAGLTIDVANRSVYSSGPSLVRLDRATAAVVDDYATGPLVQPTFADLEGDQYGLNFAMSMAFDPRVTIDSPIEVFERSKPLGRISAVSDLSQIMGSTGGSGEWITELSGPYVRPGVI